MNLRLQFINGMGAPIHLLKVLKHSLTTTDQI
jgi:hypothetical protein